MANPALQRDSGSEILAKPCGAGAATAGGTGDNTEVDGVWIDRLGYLSAKLIVGVRAVLGQGETVTLAANLQDAADSAGTGAADYGAALAATTAATGGSGGSTEHGRIVADFDLSGARRYVRAQFTPNLSRANTDTAIAYAVLMLGGADKLPAA
jgi:hypothetical protein